MQYEIIDMKEKKVVGLQIKTTNEGMKCVSDISSLWQEFMGSGIYAAIEKKADSKAIGLYTDYEGDFTRPYNFIACCEVTDAADTKEKLTEKNIPAGRYAKFTTRGHYQKAVGELWQKIWGITLERLYTFDFEVYHNNSQDMNDQMVDIYISVK